MLLDTIESFEDLFAKQECAGKIALSAYIAERVATALLTADVWGPDLSALRRSEIIEKSTWVQMAAKLKAMQNVTEKAARDLAEPNVQQATSNRVILPVWKLTKQEIADELLDLQTVAIQVGSDLVKAYAQGFIIVHRCDSIGTLTLQEVADELQALQTAMAKAARDLVMATPFLQL